MGNCDAIVKILLRRLAPSIFIAACAISSLQAGAVDSGEVRPEEYAVYNAVLGNVQMPKENAHALIVDTTLNFRCGWDSGNPIVLNGCGGMVMPPDTTEQVHELLRENWPHLEESTWQDLEKQNSRSSKLRDSFATSWKHKFIGGDSAEEKAKEWNSADCAFYLSRVGLNEKKTEAVVFVYFASYMKGVPSTGDYFLLRMDKVKGWELEGRVQYFVSDQQSR